MNRKHIIRNLRAKGIEFDHNLSTTALDAILKQSEITNKTPRVVDFTNGHGRIQVTFNKDDSEPVQIMVCEDIGKDAWTGEGFALKDLQAALDGIDKNRALDFQVNSAGGYVSAGTAIRNWLSGWGGVINQTIIGVAASTAAWCIPADKTRAYKNSQVFVHRSMAAPFGNRDDLQDAIVQLDKTDNQIAGMLAEQSESEPDEMLDLMKGANGQGTLLTGQEALDCGLIDELIDGEAKNNFSVEWLNSARQKLSTLNTLRTPQNPPLQATGNQTTDNKNKNIMNKEKMIALLNKWGVTVPENATDEQLLALVEAGKPVVAPATNKAPELDAETKALIEGFKNQAATSRRREIVAAVNKAASAEGGCKIPALEIENWVNDAVAATDHPTNGNPVLARLNKLEVRAPGVPAIPDSINKLEVISADFRDIQNGFEDFGKATESWKRGNDVPMKHIANASKGRAQFTKKFRNRFIEMMNTNTVPAQLQQQFIMQDVVIRDFARRIIGLNMFSTVFRNVPLLGLDTVDVQYYDLDSTASAPYAGSYDALVSNSVGSYRQITVGWGPAKDGDIGKGHARLVQALSFTSQEFARQPYLNIAQRAALKAEKLAFDIFQDVLGVFTVANFPNLLDAGNVITKSYDQFSSDDLADLKVACKKWPSIGRGLMIDSAYDGNLIKDPTFKSAYQIALDSVKAQGKLMPEMYGFEYLENPNIPDNGIKLRGLAFWKYCVLVAFAPVPPVEEVRRAGTNWELYTDADSEASLEYRTYGSNSGDAATHVIESNYGYAAGLKTAVKPIVSP